MAELVFKNLDKVYDNQVQAVFDFSLKVKDNKIEDIKFLSYGCASNIATGSIVTELAKGKTVDEAKSLTWKDAVDELGGLPPVKVHCSVLAVDGLKAAIEDYEEKILGVKHEKRLDEQSIIEELKSVIYPKTGNNIIDEKLVKYLKYENGKVEIEISFDETDVYKQNVLEEIDEHLREIDGIEDIDVKVVEY